MNNVKAKDLDLVVSKMLEYEKGSEIILSEFAEEKLPEWSFIKVRDCFIYLIRNYGDMFYLAEEDSKIFGEPCIIMFEIEIKHWGDTMKKGGFTAYWREKDEAYKKIKDMLDTANIGTTLANTLFSAIRSLL